MPVSYTHLDVYKRQSQHCYSFGLHLIKLKPKESMNEITAYAVSLSLCPQFEET